MAQITVTLEAVQHREERKHTFPSPITTTIGIGVSYNLTPNGSGSIILDNATKTEFSVSESVSSVTILINNSIKATSTDDYMRRVSASEVDNQFTVNKFGANTLILAGQVEDVWDFGGIYSFPSTADITHLYQGVDQAAMRGGAIEVQGLWVLKWFVIVYEIAKEDARRHISAYTVKQAAKNKRR